jgi:hypothetical protein
MRALRFSSRILVAVVVVAVPLVGLSLAYGSPLHKSGGGHGHKATTLPQKCGKYLRGAEANGLQVDPDSYAYKQPSPLGLKAGNSIDFNWVQDTNADTDFIVWDLGRKTRTVEVFPSIDHPPIPQEGLEFTLYASADPNPPDTSPKWVVANVKKVYDEGWNLEWIADNFVSRWKLPGKYRYVGIQWGGPKAAQADGDAEIDAVCVPSKNEHDDDDDHNH